MSSDGRKLHVREGFDWDAYVNSSMDVAADREATRILRDEILCMPEGEIKREAISAWKARIPYLPSGAGPPISAYKAQGGVW